MSDNFSPFGKDLFGNPVELVGRGQLEKDHTFLPFDVIDARGEAWKARKRAWASLIESHRGRSAQPGWNTRAHSNGFGEWLASVDNAGERTDFAHGWRTGHDVSVFDPCLAELAVRFWSQEGDTVSDPFAGGSVRGIVAASMGRQYYGIDLRPEQCEENRSQARSAGLDGCEWFAGDALDAPVRESTLLFTCPPYGDLERYSDDPRDLSTMDYRDFLDALSKSLRRHMLGCTGFAVIVCNSFRSKRSGNYHGLHPLPADITKAISRSDRWVLWDDCVFLTALGTVPVRASHNWKRGHKLGRCHQRVLVFRRVAKR